MQRQHHNAIRESQRDQQRDKFNDKRMELRGIEKDKVAELTTKQMQAAKAKGGQLTLKAVPGLDGWSFWATASRNDRLYKLTEDGEVEDLKDLRDPEFMDWYEKNAKFKVDGTNQKVTLSRMLKVIKSWVDVCTNVAPLIQQVHMKLAIHLYREVVGTMIDAAVYTRQKSDFQHTINCVEEYAGLLQENKADGRDDEDPETAAMFSTKVHNEVKKQLAQLRRELKTCKGADQCPGQATRVGYWREALGIKTAKKKRTASQNYWDQANAGVKQSEIK